MLMEKNALKQQVLPNQCDVCVVGQMYTHEEVNKNGRYATDYLTIFDEHVAVGCSVPSCTDSITTGGYTQ